MGARHTLQYSVFWLFELRVRQRAKGGAPSYGAFASYRRFPANRSQPKCSASACTSSRPVKQNITNSPSRLREYGRGAAYQGPAKRQTIWLSITARTLSADSVTWCGQWHLISGNVISPLRRVIAALPPTGATYQPSIPRQSSQSL
jgi:hypothetical protein